MSGRRFQLLRFVFAGLFAALAASGAFAQVVVTGFTQTGSLAANDDEHSGTLNAAGESLGFTINFGGTNYTHTYISNNGYLTFGGGSGEYIPVAFDANYLANGTVDLPIIAAFFSDVDTRDPLSGIVSWGTGMVGTNPAFVVKWPGVGEYAANSFSPNSFSITLVSRADISAGAFDVYFAYDQITWDHGGAVAGFHNASTTAPSFYQVPGSLTAGAFLDTGPISLVKSSNSGSPGDLLLQARDGAFLTPGTFVAVPEPSAYALLALGGGLLGWFHRRRRQS